MTLFTLGALWLFMISMQTVILANRTSYAIIALWTFMVSVVWVFMMRTVAISGSTSDMLLYAAGTSLGSVVATSVHHNIKR